MNAQRLVSRTIWPLGWPSLMLLGIAGGLWLLWPGGPYGDRHVRRLPEAGAAYVLHDPSSTLVYMKPDLFARPSHLGFGRALPDSLPDYPFEPYLLSPPRFLESARTLEPDPLTAAFPPLSGREDLSRYVRLRLPPRTVFTRLQWVASPSLARADLALDPPESLKTEGIWRLRLHVAPSGAAEPGGLRVFAEAEGLGEQATRAWCVWLQQALAGRTSLHGYIDVFPAQRKAYEG